MRVEQVHSVDDPRIAIYRDLPKSNLTRPSGFFIAEGELLVRRLLASEFAVESVMLDERFQDALGLPFPPDVPVYVVPHEWMSQIVGFRFHRGVLACGRRRADLRLDEVLARAGTRLTVVACVSVNDPENMGGILRNSAAFGADLVVANSSCADPFSRRVLRTSMGTVFRLPLVSSRDIAADLRRLRDEFHVELAATVLDEQAEPLHNATRPDRFGLLFGNEGHGLPPDIAALCHRRLTIPMSGGTDSLNVAVASGIFLHHFDSTGQAFKIQNCWE